MKPEEQRIAIAEAVGFIPLELSYEWSDFDNEPLADRSAYEIWICIYNIPNYLHDLNACRGMIKFLQERDYSCILTWSENKCECYFIKGESKQAGVSLSVIGDDICKVICEAFLKTLGLWKEEKS